MRIQLGRRRSTPFHQSFFAFIERPRRRERRFKQLIILTTFLAIALILRIFPWGRYLSSLMTSSASQAARWAVGFPKSRSEIDDSWRSFRQLGIEEVRRRAERVYAESSPAYQRLLRYSGMDPEHGLIRWGNFNWTILLSSVVFEADDHGRSYRFRPRTHSIWLWNGMSVDLSLRPGAGMFFLVPDEPGLADAIRDTDAVPVETSRETANSWGLRGPEPEVDAPLRGIVLGDSFMEGMFIGDDETPPECLRRYLQDHRKTRVSILNTGVFGYSPEQYYHSLIAFADRFRPQFVVVSVCANDFGDLGATVNRGAGDWAEGKYWLEKIIDYCGARQWTCLVVPAPFWPNLEGRRNSGFFPGTLTKTLDLESLMYLDPIEDFANAYLKSQIEAKKDRIRSGCPLFNSSMHDMHFSAASAEVWAASVGQRLLLLLERTKLARSRPLRAVRTTSGGVPK